jgi:MFS transporter, DHA2 family, multidrug resistance protein
MTVIADLSARSPRRKWLALASLVLAVLAVGLDGTILSIALPTLGRSFAASTSELQWFVAAYTLVFAAALVPGGMLGDRYGRKKILLLSLALFGAASIACALAPTAGTFIAARALLGLGGALMLPMVMGVIPVLFGQAERARAIGAISAAAMLGYPIGPLLGGWMLTKFDWSWVFLLNVPVVAVAVVAVAILLPESRSSLRNPIDSAGVALSATGLALLTYGVISAGGAGWGDRGAIAEMIGGCVVLAAFLIWETRVSHPLVDLRLFRSRAFTWGATLSTIVSFAMFGLLFAVPLYVQVVRGADAQGSGLRVLPLIGGMLAGGILADRIAAGAGARLVACLGFTVFAGGLALGAMTTVTTGDLQAVTWLALCGLGLGLVLPTAIDAALGVADDENSGVSSGILQALRSAGGVFGAAILGAIMNTIYRDQLSHLGSSLPASARGSAVAGADAATTAHSPALLHAVRESFLSGMNTTLWICAALMALGSVLAVTIRHRTAAAPDTTAADATATGSHAPELAA